MNATQPKPAPAITNPDDDLRAIISGWSGCFCHDCALEHFREAAGRILAWANARRDAAVAEALS